MNKIIHIVFVDDDEPIVFRHIECLAQRAIDAVADGSSASGRLAAPQIDAHKRHSYTNIISGFSISALNAPINCAPRAPSTER